MVARVTIAYQLIRPTVRAVRWAPPAAGAALGLVVVALPAALVDLKPEGWATVLRLAALAGAIGAAFVLDDPSHPSTAVVPTPRLLRRTVAIGLLLPLAAVWWAAVLITLRSVSAAPTTPEDDITANALAGPPLGDLTIEAVALFAIAVAVAAAAGGKGDGGLTGAVATLAIGLLARLPQVDLLPAPGDPRWDRAHTIWLLLALVALLTFLTAGRDTSAPRLLRRA